MFSSTRIRPANLVRPIVSNSRTQRRLVRCRRIQYAIDRAIVLQVTWLHRHPSLRGARYVKIARLRWSVAWGWLNLLGRLSAAVCARQARRWQLAALRSLARSSRSRG